MPMRRWMRLSNRSDGRPRRWTKHFGADGLVSAGAGTGIHWPDLDEDLSVEGLHRHTREPFNRTIHRMIKRTQAMPMETISANELKTAGIGAIARALDREPEVGLSVRGQLRYVVMPAAAYQRLRDCELEIALQETRADLAAGRFHAGTVEDHLRRLDGM